MMPEATEIPRSPCPFALTSAHWNGTINIGACNSFRAVAAPMSLAALGSDGICRLPLYGGSPTHKTPERERSRAQLELGCKAPATREPIVRHLIDNHLNFRRLFAEAIRDTIVDQSDRSLIEPGYYEIKFRVKLKAGQFVPFVPARIYWRDHEPGNPANKLDRWPLPVLAGEIVGQDADPILVWTGLDRRPLIVPAEHPGHTVSTWYLYCVANARWAEAHAPDEAIGRPRRPSSLTDLPPIGPPPKR